jgi:hypothetical protein
MIEPCRTCGHAANTHVEDAGPCTWRGAAPFDPCPCDAFVAEGTGSPEPSSAIGREQVLADAARAFRICYPERWDALLRALERGWAADGAGDAGFQNIAIDAAPEEEPGIQSVEIDARLTAEDTVAPDDSVPTPADPYLDRVGLAVDAGDWPAAFILLREAMNLRGGGRARSWLANVWCPSCARRITQPSPALSTADYARFWRGRCPDCQTALEIRRQ